MADPTVIAAVAGVSTVLGLISLFGYWIYESRVRQAETSLRRLVEGEGIFNAQQVVTILAQFQDDAPRLEALKALTHYDSTKAEALLAKVKANVDLGKINKQGVATRERQFTAIYLTMFALAIVAALYSWLTAKEPEAPGDSEKVSVIEETVLPTWAAANIHWPMVPAEQPEFQRKQQNVMTQCGLCMTPQDFTHVSEDGLSNRPGSHIVFDTKKCTQGIRLALTAIKLRRIPGSPPALLNVYDSVDVKPKALTTISTADVTSFQAAPVQCLD